MTAAQIRRVIHGTQMGRAARLILLAMCELAPPEAQYPAVAPGRRKLAGMTGLSASTVWAELRVLTVQGWLAPTGRRGAANSAEYRLQLPPPPAVRQS